MTIEGSIEKREGSIINSLESIQSGIDNKIGKGDAAEEKIQKDLLDPFFSPRFRCMKGSVVNSRTPKLQSEAIDRIIYDLTACPPLLHEKNHSIFPIEAVAGIVEITMYLNSSKLKKDIVHLANVRAMRNRRYLASIPGTKTHVAHVELDSVAPRSYIIGHPSNKNWKPKTIAKALQENLKTQNTFVHGVYVLGIGFFEVMPTENPNDPKYRINMWTGADRLFRFTSNFRQSLDRWPYIPSGLSVDVSGYLDGANEIFE